MSFYHHRKDDTENNLGGGAIHLLHFKNRRSIRCTLVGICWRRDNDSLIELAVFGLFFRWYFRIRSKTIMKRIKQAAKEHRPTRRLSPLITDFLWVWLPSMYSFNFDEIENPLIGPRARRTSL